MPLLVLEAETVKLEKADILEQHSLGDILVKLSVLRLTLASHRWGFVGFFQKIKQSSLDKTVVGMRRRFHR